MYFVSIRRGPQGCCEPQTAARDFRSLWISINSTGTFDAEAGEGHEAVITEAVDPDNAVLDVYFICDIKEKVEAFAKALGDTVDGRDVRDLVDGHAQATSADVP